MSKKNILSEVNDTHIAMELIRLGARLQVLEKETALSREKLIKLYKAIHGQSPPKGMLPFSADWFLAWRPNIHTSIFMSFYEKVLEHADVSDVQALISAYKLYLEACPPGDEEAVLSITRAWTYLRLAQSGVVKRMACTCCGVQFINHSLDLNSEVMCGHCDVPSRAGKTKIKANSTTDTVSQSNVCIGKSVKTTSAAGASSKQKAAAQVC
jgi:flagellar transcriptional activator FlhC